MKNKKMRKLTFIIALFFWAIVVNAQNTGINTITPNADADLHLGSTNRGLLLNRVSLVSRDNPAPLTAHTEGMFVHNINTGGIAPNNVVPGLYFNSGTEWILLQTSGFNFAEIPGTIAIHSGDTTSIPTGYLECNGQAISRTTYASLFSTIGTTYGIGDGSTTFNLPDLRGEFIRGWDDGRLIDVGRALGSTQLDVLKEHRHQIWNSNLYAGAGGSGTGPIIMNSIGTITTDYRTGPAGGTETRPRNIAMIYLIKI